MTSSEVLHLSSRLEASLLPDTPGSSDTSLPTSLTDYSLKTDLPPAGPSKYQGHHIYLNLPTDLASLLEELLEELQLQLLEFKQKWRRLEKKLGDSRNHIIVHLPKLVKTGDDLGYTSHQGYPA